MWCCLRWVLQKHVERQNWLEINTCERNGEEIGVGWRRNWTSCRSAKLPPIQNAGGTIVHRSCLVLGPDGGNYPCPVQFANVCFAWEGCDFRWGSSLLLREPLKELTTGGSALIARSVGISVSATIVLPDTPPHGGTIKFLVWASRSACASSLISQVSREDPTLQFLAWKIPHLGRREIQNLMRITLW